MYLCGDLQDSTNESTREIRDFTKMNNSKRDLNEYPGLIDPLQFNQSEISLVFCDDNPDRKPRKNRYKKSTHTKTPY